MHGHLILSKPSQSDKLDAQIIRDGTCKKDGYRYARPKKICDLCQWDKIPNVCCDARNTAKTSSVSRDRHSDVCRGDLRRPVGAVPIKRMSVS